MAVKARTTMPVRARPALPRSDEAIVAAIMMKLRYKDRIAWAYEARGRGGEVASKVTCLHSGDRRLTVSPQSHPTRNDVGNRDGRNGRMDGRGRKSSLRDFSHPAPESSFKFPLQYVPVHVVVSFFVLPIVRPRDAARIGK